MMTIYENYNSILNSNNYNYSINNLKKIISNYDKYAVCFLDISNFKYYNYMFGYEYGDEVLKLVFDKVQKCINRKGYVYRFTGNVFLILISSIECKDNVITVIDKIIDTFNNPFEISEKKLRILINIGISLYPDDSRNIDTILKYAEIALNEVKKVYSDKYRFFDIDMYRNVIRRWKIESDILNAIHNKEFTLYYQPQINIKTMKVYGMEALLRWKHPKYGVVSPQSFIDIVEKNGMINEIGKFVFQEACSEMKKCHELGYSNLSMSVNIAERQFEDSSFLDFIDDTLKKTQVEPKYISIEITERILIDPTKKILSILTALSNRGIKVFIDDFGTKYSSLNYLYRFPVAGIKIDKSFIDRIQDSKKELIIIKNIIKLAHEINLEVVAEGVERKEQLDCLSNIDCHKIQGFIFGKPVDSSKFIDFLKLFNN